MDYLCIAIAGQLRDKNIQNLSQNKEFELLLILILPDFTF